MTRGPSLTHPLNLSRRPKALRLTQAPQTASGRTMISAESQAAQILENLKELILEARLEESEARWRQGDLLLSAWEAGCFTDEQAREYLGDCAYSDSASRNYARELMRTADAFPDSEDRRLDASFSAHREAAKWATLSQPPKSAPKLIETVLEAAQDAENAAAIEAGRRPRAIYVPTVPMIQKYAPRIGEAD